MNTLLIDGNNLVFRAYYGLPLLKAPNGKICNAVYGFCNMLIHSIEAKHPDYILVAFDKGKSTFRHKLYPEYKAQRSTPPEDLMAQFPMVKDMLSVMGIKYFEDERFEADDIIGTLSKEDPTQDVIILSGDKDLLQLVSDNVSINMGKITASDADYVTPSNIVEKYGVRADQVVDLKALMGDPSDNIPGVAGIGQKIATTLIHDYDNLENVYNNCTSLTPKLSEKLVAGKEMAKLSKTLATIDTKCELGFSIKDCTYTFPFSMEVKSAFEGLSFNSFTSKSQLFSGEESVATPVADDSTATEQISTIEQFDQIYQQITQTGRMAICYQNNCWHISFSRYYEYVISSDLAIDADFSQKLATLLASGKVEKTIYDAKELMHQLSNANINNIFDISLALNIISQPDRVFNLVEGLTYLHMPAVHCAAELLVVRNNLYEQLSQRKQLDLYYNIEMPLIKVLYNMEVQGFKLDRQELSQLEKKYEAELKQIESKIFELATHEFNINSPQQVSNLLFNELMLKYKGKKSTSVEVLEAIADQHPIVNEIMRYRKVQKLLSTYLTGFLPYLDDKDKVHTNFIQSITSTGRLASRSPNLQNIPVRDEEGKALRKLFVSSFAGGVISSADYNQIELRLMAHFSQDTNMVSSFRAGYDIHASTAAKIFQIPLEEVTKKQRSIAKSVNFGIIYGISEYGLAKNIGMSTQQARDFINKYFQTFPAVKSCMDSLIDAAKETGYSTTMFNRRRYISELQSANAMIRKFGERAAINAPLQGSASDIIKLAMLKVAKAIEQQGLKSRLILQIHDELIVDTHPDELQQVAKLLQDNMNDVVSLAVPLLVEVSQGKSWFDCK